MLSFALRSTSVSPLHSGHQVTKGRYSGLVLLAHWDLLVLSVNAFAAAGLSIVYRPRHIRIPFSVPKTTVLKEAGKQAGRVSSPTSAFLFASQLPESDAGDLFEGRPETQEQCQPSAV
jgi:hypothetical protein